MKLLFTKEHEWVKVDGKTATMGISDHAQHSLGDITFVELPAIGAVCKQSAQIATVESVKAASDVYAPVSGKVTEINDEVEATPETLNISPYEKGWICKIELSNKEELSSLMDQAQYDEYVKGL
ncbi:MAG: glycine cleavage system protein GcvH [Candidatus Omnitrophica bacterium]|jgi:glycine cleavage system H protein|nr:glycine cleavage system protein GcvH [Candidatus Omnitrophota bacterium]